jgi:hypothetical protein
MSEKKESPAKNKLSPDWLVRGVLAKLGDTFDKFLGRDWKPSSTLATSELIERLKRLLDQEVKDYGEKGRFVPHHIKLKMQWDKFSTDAEEAMRRLEYELLAAAIDHINDRRYHTYAPLDVQAKPDYFTEGVKLWASFEEFGEDEKEAELDVTVPQMNVETFVPPEPVPEPETENFTALFTTGEKQKSVELKFTKGKRLSVGRTKENHLSLDDTSVSKNHATLAVSPEGKLLVADTGSTNGTFINDERIAYGRALEVGEGDRVKFGEIEVFFRRVPKAAGFVAADSQDTEDDDTKLIRPGKTENQSASNGVAAATAGAAPAEKSEISEPAPTEPAVKLDFGDAGSGSSSGG